MSKINYKKYLPHLVAVILLFIPISLFPLTGSSGATIQNPLGSNNTSVDSLLNKVMTLVATVGAIVVVLFIIYSGFKFVTARGNEAEVTKAKEIFWATIIGGAILLGSGVIATVVINTVKDTVKK